MFALPGESNFSGVRYDLGVIPRAVEGDFTGAAAACAACGGRGRCWVLLDAAKLAATSRVDLPRGGGGGGTGGEDGGVSGSGGGGPDFVVVSFYKLFGWPTGLGALLVSTRAAEAGVLRNNKAYFGGGTVAAALAGTRFHRLRPALAPSLEDGTLPFLSIIAAESGLAVLKELGMDRVSAHTRRLASHTHAALAALTHGSGQPVCKFYGAWLPSEQLCGALQPVSRVWVWGCGLWVWVWLAGRSKQCKVPWGFGSGVGS